MHRWIILDEKEARACRAHILHGVINGSGVAKQNVCVCVCGCTWPYCVKLAACVSHMRLCGGTQLNMEEVIQMQ